MTWHHRVIFAMSVYPAGPRVGRFEKIAQWQWRQWWRHSEPLPPSLHIVDNKRRYLRPVPQNGKSVNGHYVPHLGALSSSCREILRKVRKAWLRSELDSRDRHDKRVVCVIRRSAYFMGASSIRSILAAAHPIATTRKRGTFACT